MGGIGGIMARFGDKTDAEIFLDPRGHRLPARHTGLLRLAAQPALDQIARTVGVQRHIGLEPVEARTPETGERGPFACVGNQVTRPGCRTDFR